jgi:hypothetical protein
MAFVTTQFNLTSQLYALPKWNDGAQYNWLTTMPGVRVVPPGHFGSTALYFVCCLFEAYEVPQLTLSKYNILKSYDSETLRTRQ